MLVIFGGGGDLAWSKLIPALFNLHLDNHLPGRFAMSGVARKRLDDDKFRQHLHECQGAKVKKSDIMIRVYTDLVALSHAASELFAAEARQTVKACDTFLPEEAHRAALL